MELLINRILKEKNKRYLKQCDLIKDVLDNLFTVVTLGNKAKAQSWLVSAVFLGANKRGSYMSWNLMVGLLLTVVIGMTGCGGGGSDTPYIPVGGGGGAVTNTAPLANAGANQSVTTGTVVTLDGSASSDANGDALTYSWSFTSKPAGSNTTLSSTTVVKPTFTADVAGTYVLKLVVNDGKVSSAAATVTVTASVGNAVLFLLSVNRIETSQLHPRRECFYFTASSGRTYCGIRSV